MCFIVVLVQSDLVKYHLIKKKKTGIGGGLRILFLFFYIISDMKTFKQKDYVKHLDYHGAQILMPRFVKTSRTIINSSGEESHVSALMPFFPPKTKRSSWKKKTVLKKK